MNKLLAFTLIGSLLVFGDYGYKGSTTSVVTVVGGIIKAQNTEVSDKYKRKDCPVCKGKGWYISGDDITKVNCGYCEPDKQQPKTATPQQSCDENGCKTKVFQK
jgi:hypothetical protein